MPYISPAPREQITAAPREPTTPIPLEPITTDPREDGEPVKTVLPGRDALSQELARPTWKPVRRRRPMTSTPSAPTVKPAVEQPTRILRVAAYARVSTGLESQETSLDNQVSHYSSLIASEPAWTLAGLYCEKDVSATNADRPELKRLISDCRAGHIDLILTKSISRFSRNTADCLRLVRELTGIGVNLWFEKENIHTDRMESEFLLSILSAFAQDESRSISKNVRWGIQARFRNGTYVNTKAPYGYHLSSSLAASPSDPSVDTEEAENTGVENSTSAYEICPAEAEIVRRIFSCVLEGMGTTSIANMLNRERVPTWTQSRAAASSSTATPSTGVDEETVFGVDAETGEPDEVDKETDGGPGGRWYANTIRNIIRNPFYVGDCLYQKTFMDENYVQRINTGQFDQYLDEGNHPAIITRAVWEEANRRLDCWKDPKNPRHRAGSSCFSGKTFCSLCGKALYRKPDGQRPRLNHITQQFEPGEPRCGTRILLPSLENVIVTMLNKIYTALKGGLPIVSNNLASEVLACGLQEEFDSDFFEQNISRVDIGEGKITVSFSDGTVLTERIPPQFTVTSKATLVTADEDLKKEA